MLAGDLVQVEQHPPHGAVLLAVLGQAVDQHLLRHGGLAVGVQDGDLFHHRRVLGRHRQLGQVFIAQQLGGAVVQQRQGGAVVAGAGLGARTGRAAAPGRLGFVEDVERHGRFDGVDLHRGGARDVALQLGVLAFRFRVGGQACGGLGGRFRRLARRCVILLENREQSHVASRHSPAQCWAPDS